MPLDVKGFVTRRSDEGRGSPSIQQMTYHGSQPSTAQGMLNNQKQNTLLGTDTESLETTHQSLDHRSHEGFNGVDHQAVEGQEQQQHQDDDDLDDNQDDNGVAPIQIFDEKLSGLMDYMHQMRSIQSHHQQGPTELDSYPPTTSGEPESIDERVLIEYPAMQTQTSRPHGTYMANAPQQRDYSVVRPFDPTRGLASEQLKSQFKHNARPTVSRQDIALRKRSKGKPSAVIQYVPAIESREHPLSHNPASQPFAQAQHTAGGRIASVPEGSPQTQTNGTDHQQESSYIDEVNHDYGHLPAKLDYDLEELYNKDLASLQNDPFDGPARGNSETVPSDMGSMTFEKKLNEFAKHDPQSQMHFFSSLNIAEWEEAGEWFQDRFSHILKGLRQVRRQRRELAAEFEQEVKGRQKAITKKRKITDDALAVMKKSGEMVLEGTPKKKQKHKQ